MSGIAHFEITGPATAGRTRAAGMLDLLTATIIAMLVLPQPVVRAAVMGEGATALSIAIFVSVMVLAVLLVLLVYLAVSAVYWGRSPAMYLLDLGLDAPSKPTTGEALLWGLGWALAALPALTGARSVFDPESGLPARLSSLPTRSTAKV